MSAILSEAMNLWAGPRSSSVILSGAKNLWAGLRYLVRRKLTCARDPSTKLRIKDPSTKLRITNNKMTNYKLLITNKMTNYKLLITN